MDTMHVEILPDGTIKAETGEISQLNHSTAEAFMRRLAEAGGGPQTRRARHGTMDGHVGHHVGDEEHAR